jgi:hypothetical protein
MERSGVELINAGWDPVANQRMIIGWKAPGMTGDESAKVLHGCRALHLDETESRYIKDNPARMSTDLMLAIRECLGGNGLPTTGLERTAQDLIEAVPESRQMNLHDCVHESAKEVYPDLKVVLFPQS